jgi:hypothetical protein
MPRSSKLCLPFRFPNQNFEFTSHLPIHVTCCHNSFVHDNFWLHCLLCKLTVQLVKILPSI